jgi:hypothetical protein
MHLWNIKLPHKIVLHLVQPHVSMVLGIETTLGIPIGHMGGNPHGCAQLYNIHLGGGWHYH